MTHPAQKIRESLFQLLFSQEFADSSPEETLAVIVKEVGLDDKTAVRLLEEWRAYDRRKLFLEEAIEHNLSSYKKQELGKIELSLLRCGAYELLEKKTPPPSPSQISFVFLKNSTIPRASL